MKNKNKLIRFSIYIFVASAILTSTSNFANPVPNNEAPEFVKTAPTVEQYHSAIQAFGVNQKDAAVAAQVAANAQSDNQEIDVDNLLTQLPSDFLEGSPY